MNVTANLHQGYVSSLSIISEAYILQSLLFRVRARAQHLYRVRKYIN